MSKENYTKNNRRYYMEGNTARQLHELPRYNYPIEQDGEQVRVDKQVKKRKKSKKQPAVDFFAFIVLTGGIILMLYTCVTYVQVQSSITHMNKEISSLESSLTKKKNENAAMESIISTSMDLDYIYKIATSKLGMVYPQNNQVIEYDSVASGYVRQYENIPEANKSGVLDRILK